MEDVVASEEGQPRIHWRREGSAWDSNGSLMGVIVHDDAHGFSGYRGYLIDENKHRIPGKTTAVHLTKRGAEKSLEKLAGWKNVV
jgi:hypothetical protein